MTDKTKNIFSCKLCNFKTCKYSKWERHLLTKKHIKNSELDTCKVVTTNKQEVTIKNNSEFICECGKHYKYKQSFSRHRKSCDYIKKIDDSKENNSEKNNDEIYEKLMKQNKDLVDTIKTQSEQITELLPKIGNTTNNTMNNFNINLFLNNDCKDALNLTDFVRSIQLQLTDLEDTARLGYVDGMTNIIVRGLNEMDINKRPIHCSDGRRNILYVKDNDAWEREQAGNIKMKRAIELINRANIKQIPKWINENPESKDSEDPKNAIYMNMLWQTMDDADVQEKKNAKVVKNIAKTVLIDGKNDNMIDT